MKSSQQLVAEAKAVIKEVDVATLLSALDDHHTVLIDVRETDEYDKGHIDRSVNYPRGMLEMQIHQHPSVSHHFEPMNALEELSSKPIYVICRSGARSALATQTLMNMGFENVMSVAGGMNAWSEAGYPIEV
ncbi:rhodanese-like domain-containing protein [Paraneptunicella aestuarii]|uniref:rhodanese-like domain-containing protein n=1 Tax=Paraneptunicella aestuarii TaxID=2831148 RepID=UPI001E2FAD88|nr:rhodanese-like domain-containing protein [Paraneptunicella aestuarii]UAA38928.1 rhodanese-like domain-containing protein [Paraneptunicella aestuarii]